MQGRRQGVEQKLNDHPDRWLSLLSPFRGQAEERGEAVLVDGGRGMEAKRLQGFIGAPSVCL